MTLRVRELDGAERLLQDVIEADISSLRDELHRANRRRETAAREALVRLVNGTSPVPSAVTASWLVRVAEWVETLTASPVRVVAPGDEGSRSPWVPAAGVTDRGLVWCASDRLDSTEHVRAWLIPEGTGDRWIESVRFLTEPPELRLPIDLTGDIPDRSAALREVVAGSELRRCAEALRNQELASLPGRGVPDAGAEGRFAVPGGMHLARDLPPPSGRPNAPFVISGGHRIEGSLGDLSLLARHGDGLSALPGEVAERLAPWGLVGPV